MSAITTIFCDIGGVLLTDGWGHAARRQAVAEFGLDEQEFGQRHEYVSRAIETDEMSLEQYLDRVVFYEPRPFSREQFKAFMFGQSQPYEEHIALIGQIAESGRYQMATLNNEILELNLYRISQFDLAQHFSVFLSSCFLRMRKPDEEIYEAALRITHRQPQECLFIDDREANLESPRMMGMQTILFRQLDQLREELRKHGVDAVHQGFIG